MLPRYKKQQTTTTRRIAIRPKNYRVGICTRICHIITFVPFGLLCFERLYIPLEFAGSDLSSYMDVENVAKTTKLKNPILNEKNAPLLSKLTDTYTRTFFHAF